MTEWVGKKGIKNTITFFIAVINILLEYTFYWVSRWTLKSRVGKRGFENYD